MKYITSFLFILLMQTLYLHQYLYHNISILSFLKNFSWLYFIKYFLKNDTIPEFLHIQFVYLILLYSNKTLNGLKCTNHTPHPHNLIFFFFSSHILSPLFSSPTPLVQTLTRSPLYIASSVSLDPSTELQSTFPFLYAIFLKFRLQHITSLSKQKKL